MIKLKEPAAEGVKVSIRGEVLIVPPLNFRQLKEHAAELEAFSMIGKSTNVYKDMEAAIPVITSALRRNYPDITLEEISDMIDLGNYRTVFEAVMGVSGINQEILRKHKVVAAGESEPAAVTANPVVQ